MPRGLLRRLTLDLGLLLAIAASLGLGPRLVDGLAALEWTRYYAAQGLALSKSADAGAKAGRSAARAIDKLAPLPAATQAARLGLDLGRKLLSENPAAAQALLAEVRGALERARQTWGGAVSFDTLTAEARGLEAQARDKAQAARP